MRKLTVQRNDPEESAKILLRDPWQAMKCDGFGFKKVDGIRKKLQAADPDNFAYSEENAERVYYGAYDVLENRVFRDGHTYINLYEFKNLMIMDLGLRKDVVNDFVEQDYAICDGIIPFFRIKVDSGLITSQRMYDSEELIYDSIKYANTPREFHNWDENLQEFMSKQDFELTDEQLAIFKSVNENQFSLLTGSGGTGKTFTVAKLIQFAKSQGIKITLAAPTGKAAQVLTNYSGFPANTIHNSFKIIPGINTGGGEIPKYKPHLIVIDEFSMVNAELLGDIFRTYTDKNVPLPRFLFIGDEYQLPSVGAGNLLHNFIKLKLVNLTRLTKVFRIKSETGGIVQLTESLRQGRFPYKNNDGQWFTVGKDFIGRHTDLPEDSFQQAVAAYKKMLSVGVSPEEIVVLTPKNKGLTGQQNLNIVLQEVARKSFGLDMDAPNRSYKSYGNVIRFYEGDLIMCLHNLKMFISDDENASIFDFSVDSPSVDISNGDVGKVLYVGMDFLLVEFNGESVFVADSELSQFQLGYAYTIHKSQGSEAKYGILLATKQDAFQLNANLLYTGASRFKEKLYLIGNYNTIRNKSKVFINQSRRTLLEVIDNDELAVF